MMRRYFAHDPRLDGLLRLTPALESAYEAEHGQARIDALRRSIVVGIILYNAYSVTTSLLLRDVLWISVVVRLVLVTPVSLVLAWSVDRMNGWLREHLVLAALLNAFLLPLGLFWFSADPYAGYTFAELSLTLFYASMMLQLRFALALVFTLATFVAAAIALVTKPDLSSDLAFAFTVQYAMASILTLYANWCAESLRCRSFLRDCDARQEIAGAQSRSQAFEILSQVDALTNLPNRRALDQTLDDWFREDRPLAVLMIDVDHFKPFNDRLGHLEGDACLRAIARTLSQFARRPGVVVARFGGEEFSALVQDRNEMEAARLADLIVKSILDLAIPHPSRPDDLRVVTISVGVAWTDRPAGSSPSQILAAADAALYRAKRSGRNQWAMAGDADAAALESATA